MRRRRGYPTLLELLRRGRGGALVAGGALVVAGAGCEGAQLSGKVPIPEPDVVLAGAPDVPPPVDMVEDDGAGLPGGDTGGGRDVLPPADLPPARQGR